MQRFVNGIENLEKELTLVGCKKFLLVTDSSFGFLNIKDDIQKTRYPFVKFDGFSSNPLHEDADRGIGFLVENDCNVIVAVGGGSSLDVAKCIKLDIKKDIPLIAIPTTAGTGSESTRHIVVYKDGKKESLGDESVIPNTVIFEPSVLKTLPLYQKKCTMLDALCQGIESYWSVNATKETRELYSKSAIEKIVGNMDSYLNGDDNAAAIIMEAANLSGRAINVTQTTAAHAMSYKLTSMYKLPHGHAVAVCLPEVFDTMLKKNHSDEQGKVFSDVAKAMGKASPEEAVIWFREMLTRLQMAYPVAVENKENEVRTLTESVNPVRLKNNPIQFTTEELNTMYGEIVK